MQLKASSHRGPAHEDPPLDYSHLSRELVVALRGRRSQAAFSRRLGYRSNVVHRWEAEQCWPTAAVFLQACERQRIDVAQAFTRFFYRRPAWLDGVAPTSPEAVARLLTQLRGKTPILTLAEASGFNRYTVSRWLKGTAEPRLPEFLALVDAASRRVVDFVAALVDPARVPCVAQAWKQLEQSREAAYREPWSHAVLRALELDAYESGEADDAWIAEALGIPAERVARSFEVLAATGQVHREADRWRPEHVATVHTAQNPERARETRRAWTEIALQRLAENRPGHYGYSIFAISKMDLVKLRDLHTEYVRAMQDVIHRSKSNECVALYCAQLLDLRAGPGNALA